MGLWQIEGQYVEVSCVTGWLLPDDNRQMTFSIEWFDWFRHILPLLFFAIMVAGITLTPTHPLDRVARGIVIAFSVMWLAGLGWLAIWAVSALRMIRSLTVLTMATG